MAQQKPDLTTRLLRILTAILFLLVGLKVAGIVIDNLLFGGGM